MSAPTLEIKQGQLLGKTETDYKGGKYYSFRGIPYAKPPLGELRFKAPQPPEPWIGIFDATKESVECYQRHPITQSIIGSEDCLVLNVYTRTLNKKGASDSGKPVMVWIHGGSFLFGSCKSESYGPEFLIQEDVVFVAINYRLGVLGFLSLEDSSLGVPGNAGLKDMVMALKWVQNNINYFGGDLNNVTIFGQSAGGSAAHYLMLSPMAKGLFHRAIAQSGTALHSWSHGFRCANQLAKYLALEYVDDKEVLDFLRALPVEKLFRAQESVKDDWDKCNIRPFGPVIEKSTDELAFLTKDPLDIIRSGDYNMVPFIIGYTNKEGMILHVACKRDYCKFDITNPQEIIPYDLKQSLNCNLQKQVAKRIREFYYGSEEPTRSHSKNLYQLHTDVFAIIDHYRTVKYMAFSHKAPMYFYRMSIESDLNLHKKLRKTNTSGVCHSDDLGYIFNMPFSPILKPGSIEQKSVHRFVKLWTTFARYGNPNPPETDYLIDVEWNPVKAGELHFLDIGENLTVDVNPDADRMTFWDELYKLDANN